MTSAKIAISLAPQYLKMAKNAVSEGRAASVSAYVARALERQAQEETLDVLVRDLIATYGEPTAKDEAWAKRALTLPRKRTLRSTRER